MMTVLSILGSSGDITVTWDHNDPAAREKARQEVERLRAAGYSFFLADGTPADAVAAGAGTLLVRRLEPPEVIDPPPSPAAPTSESDPPAADAAPRRRGRPPKADRHVVAVRPIRGG